MKKLTAFILAAVLLLSLGAIALADGTTTLTTTVPAATYTLTIPEDVTVTYGVHSVYVGELDAEATSGFAVGKNLKVTMTYIPFSCESVSTTIPYEVEGFICSKTGTYSYGMLESGCSFLFICTDTNKIFPSNLSGSPNFDNYRLDLCFSNADWGKALAGDYTATMTFTSEIVAAEE